uniref:Uncharacterized protein n=1 Tax=Homalodisca liturata TaxID=320908 RepID=A0A1B6H909_9HEMI
MIFTSYSDFVYWSTVFIRNSNLIKIQFSKETTGNGKGKNQLLKLPKSLATNRPIEPTPGTEKNLMSLKSRESHGCPGSITVSVKILGCKGKSVGLVYCRGRLFELVELPR